MGEWTYRDDEDAENVEEYQAVKDALDGSGYGLARVLGLTKGGGDNFSTEEPDHQSRTRVTASSCSGRLNGTYENAAWTRHAKNAKNWPHRPGT